MGVAGLLIPRTPAMDGMASLFKRAQCVCGKAVLHVQRVARLAERETTGQESRQLDGFLDVQAEVDHASIKLELDLRLAIRAHAAKHAPELAVSLGHGRDQGMQRYLPGFEAIGMGWIEGEIRPSTTPVLPATTHDPNAPYRLWMSEAALPSRSTAAM